MAGFPRDSQQRGRRCRDGRFRGGGCGLGFVKGAKVSKKIPLFLCLSATGVEGGKSRGKMREHTSSLKVLELLRLLVFAVILFI